MRSTSWYRQAKANREARQHKRWATLRANAEARAAEKAALGAEACEMGRYDQLIGERDALRHQALAHHQLGEATDAEIAERAADGRDQQAIDRYPKLYRRFNGKISTQR